MSELLSREETEALGVVELGNVTADFSVRSYRNPSMEQKGILTVWAHSRSKMESGISYHTSNRCVSCSSEAQHYLGNGAFVGTDAITVEHVTRGPITCAIGIVHI